MVALNAIHTKMHRQMAAVGGRIDAVFYCPHTAEEECSCRKPAPACWSRFASAMAWSRTMCWWWGNCQAHLQAGAALGAKLHLVCTGHAAGLQPGRRCPRAGLRGIQVHASLAQWVEQLLPATPQSQPVPAPSAVG